MGTSEQKQKRNCHIPRIMIAAARSGGGKTTVTCGLLEALKEEGLHPCSFKCGPDYIDPMFHRNVLGIASGNLDAYFADGKMLRYLLASEYEEAGADIAVIEGVMGYYDGLGGTTSVGSAYHLAQETETPVILVIDAKGASVTLAAEIRGLLEYGKRARLSQEHLRTTEEQTSQEQITEEQTSQEQITERQTDEKQAAGEQTAKERTAWERTDEARTDGCRQERSGIAGILLNRASKGFYPRLKALIEEECGVPVVGYLPEMQETLSSRHLGLVQPEEIPEMKKWIHDVGAQISATVDLNLVKGIAKSAPDLPADPDLAEAFCKKKKNLRIAYARDEAFTFSYKENENLLREMGAELVYFSPIHDRTLPDDIDGLVLTGGYPELHVQELEANASMRESVREAVNGGLPTIAECGGFLYLCDSLTDTDGHTGEMCGVIHTDGKPAGRLQRFGYFEAETARGGLFGPAGTHLRGHEFHHWDTDLKGNGMVMKKALSERTERAVVYTDTLAAGFPHFYYAAYPEVAAAYLDACAGHADACAGHTDACAGHADACARYS